MSEHDQGQFEMISIGERLRLAREAKGMSLDDVAGRTRIPIRHLQNIEMEEWDALPAATYAIGFARNYANAVGLDGAQIGGELRERIGGPRRRAPAAEYYEPADPSRVPPRSIAIVAAIVAMVLILGYLLWWRTGNDAPDAAIPVLEVTAPQAAPAPPPPAVSPQAAAGQIVTLTATGDVWLRITDGDGGAPLFSGNLAAGQTYQLPATAVHPMIRTGRPQLLRASVGDTDLGPLEATEHTVEGLSLRPEDLAARPRVQAAPAPTRPQPQPGAPLSAPPPQ